MGVASRASGAEASAFVPASVAFGVRGVLEEGFPGAAAREWPSGVPESRTAWFPVDILSP
jgi:hypothetical protein